MRNKSKKLLQKFVVEGEGLACTAMSCEIGGGKQYKDGTENVAKDEGQG